MNDITTKELQQMIADIALGFQETRAMFQETDRKFQESERQMKQSNQETWAMFQESQRQMKQSNQETRAMFQETDRKFQETDRKFQESKIENDKMMKDLSDNLKKTESLFNSQWGKLVESLVEGDLIKLLEARGIEVKRTLERVKGNPGGQNFEFDIVAVNGQEIVVVEVKTHLKNKDVRDFVAKLEKVKTTYLPEYKDKKIYGAIAYLRADGASDIHATNKKLFVIRATGSSASIINDPDFVPRVF